jgi:acyl-CoA synthetase (NDP forming)
VGTQLTQQEIIKKAKEVGVRNRGGSTIGEMNIATNLNSINFQEFKAAVLEVSKAVTVSSIGIDEY